MSAKVTAVRQYQAIVDGAAGRFGEKRQWLPPEGWIATMRKALGMSGARLAKRLGVTRARVSQAEQAELHGGVTLKTMRATAEAMGCHFVYAIIPEGRTQDVIAAQARKKAQELVRTAGAHMALEDQALTEAQNADEADRIAEDLIRSLPADLWVDT